MKIQSMAVQHGAFNREKSSAEYRRAEFGFQPGRHPHDELDVEQRLRAAVRPEARVADEAVDLVVALLRVLDVHREECGEVCLVL